MDDQLVVQQVLVLIEYLCWQHMQKNVIITTEIQQF
jgi:hypothetical protein